MPMPTLEALADKVEALLPDPIVRATQLSLFADSLEYVYSYDSSLSLTHILSDRIRLFAGRLIVLTLKDDSVWVTTDDSLKDDRLSTLPSWTWDAVSYPRYKRPPSRNGYYKPSDDDHQDWLLIHDAHFAYLDRVLARRHNPDARSVARHEPLMAEYLSTVLGREVPSLRPVSLPEEVTNSATYSEGAVERVFVNRFERDRRARDECLRLFGHRCAACGMSFAQRYGPEVDGLIHVHHVVPLSEIREGYAPDPASDLVPICPNCHAVIHARKGTTRTIADVQRMLRRANNGVQSDAGERKIATPDGRCR